MDPLVIVPEIELAINRARYLPSAERHNAFNRVNDRSQLLMLEVLVELPDSLLVH